MTTSKKKMLFLTLSSTLNAQKNIPSIYEKALCFLCKILRKQIFSFFKKQRYYLDF